jgi:light-regulated signal transduction histidine kinase (bacteriophytochrome)
MEEIFKSVMMDLTSAIEENKAVITHDLLPEIPGSRLQLRQLLQNLIANGIKYRSAHAPQIHVSTQRHNGSWIFSVRDNGIGIDPQYKDRVFMIFKRLHSKDKYPGTGIGLAICKKIVDQHGGEIWLDSEPGKGSVFYFSLPLNKERHAFAENV